MASYSPFPIGFRLNSQEASGNPDYMKALQDAFSGIQGAYDTAYKPKQLAEELLKSKLSNKQAQENLNNAPLQRQLLEAKIQSALTSGSLSQTKANLINSILNGGTFGNNPDGQNNNGQADNNLSPFITGRFGQNQSVPGEGQSNAGQSQSSGATNNRQMPNYAKAALASQIAGLGQPKIVNVDGRQVAITPFGTFDTGVKGLNPEEKAFATSLGKEKGTFYSDSVRTANALNSQELALNQMVDSLDNSQFRNVTGPVKSSWTKWFGTPEQKELLGNLQTSSGEIALQVAPSLKGAFTERDQTLINSIKANPQTDFADTFLGKLKAQLLIGKTLKQRAQLQAQYIEDGYSELNASKKAAEQTPLSRFKPEVDKLIKSHASVLLIGKNGEMYKVPFDKANSYLEKHKDLRRG